MGHWNKTQGYRAIAKVIIDLGCSENPNDRTVVKIMMSM